MKIFEIKRKFLRRFVQLNFDRRIQTTSVGRNFLRVGFPRHALTFARAKAQKTIFPDVRIVEEENRRRGRAES